MESKSEAIRRLYREGKSVAEIARELGLTYQRVYNTLKRSGLLKPKAEGEPDPETYAKFIQGLEIRSVELVEVHAKLERSPKGKLAFKMGLEAFGPEPSEGGFSAGLVLSLDFQDEKGPFGFVRLRVRARYATPLFPDEALFRAFRERNLIVHLWPYLRLYVDFLTAQMGLPRLVLPAWKV
jgi:transposase-like protein